jgi:predicted small secreted protein
MKSQIFKTILVASLLALMGCNTVEGVGQDIEAGGAKVQDKAKEVKREM